MVSITRKKHRLHAGMPRDFRPPSRQGAAGASGHRDRCGIARRPRFLRLPRSNSLSSSFLSFIKQKKAKEPKGFPGLCFLCGLLKPKNRARCTRRFTMPFEDEHERRGRMGENRATGSIVTFIAKTCSYTLTRVELLSCQCGVGVNAQNFEQIEAWAN